MDVTNELLRLSNKAITTAITTSVKIYNIIREVGRGELTADNAPKRRAYTIPYRQARDRAHRGGARGDGKGRRQQVMCKMSVWAWHCDAPQGGYLFHGNPNRGLKLEWVESIVDQCRSAGVPVFVKQLDIGGECVTDINKFPKHLQIRQVPWAEKGYDK